MKNSTQQVLKFSVWILSEIPLWTEVNHSAHNEMYLHFRGMKERVQNNCSDPSLNQCKHMQCSNSHSVLRNYKQIFLWSVWLLTLKGNWRQLWRYLPFFNSLSQWCPLGLFWLPKQNTVNDFGGCIPALPLGKVKHRGISPAMNSGLSPPADQSLFHSPAMSFLNFQLTGVHKSLLFKTVFHSSVPSSTTEVK